MKKLEQTRRDRRKAKQSGFAREPGKAGRVVHHNYEGKFYQGRKLPT